MVWTKLAYLRFPECIRPQLVNGAWRGAEVGARYRNVLRKEFLKAGVPWEYEVKAEASTRNPFDRSPKHTKDQHNKATRIRKIIKALENQDTLIAKHHQDRSNSKRLVGADYLVKSTLGSFIKTTKKGTVVE